MRYFTFLTFTMVLFFSTLISYGQTIQGNWKYVSTTLDAESAGNIRKQLNSDVKLEQKMNQCLNKVGFRAGSTLNFDGEGNFFQRINGKSFPGTYTCASSMKQLSLIFENSSENIEMDMNYQPTQILLTVPAEKYMNLVNVNETKANAETICFLRSLITQFEGTKLVMKYIK